MFLPFFYLTLGIEKAFVLQKIHDMANKRDLKRTINYVSSDLFAEGVAHSLYDEKPVEENVEAILTSILKIHTEFVSRISHPEPGMKRKAYYKKLVEDFNKNVNEIIDQLNGLN